MTTKTQNYAMTHLAEDPSHRGFFKEVLGLTGMEISRTVLDAGENFPITHKHTQNEELYICLGGEGQMLIDGDLFPFSEGTFVRISPEGDRGLRNTGKTPLFYLCIQVKANSLTQWTEADGVVTSETVTWPDA